MSIEIEEQELADYDPLDNTLFELDERAHIRVIKQETCQNDCPDRSCANFCPGQVFYWENNQLQVDYTRCVECAACLYSCLQQNIHWEYPRGGYGVVFLY